MDLKCSFDATLLSLLLCDMILRHLSKCTDCQQIARESWKKLVFMVG